MSSDSNESARDLLIRIDERVGELTKVIPLLDERIDKLEGHKDKLYGAGGLLTVLGTIAEWFLHRK